MLLGILERINCRIYRQVTCFCYSLKIGVHVRGCVRVSMWMCDLYRIIVVTGQYRAIIPVTTISLLLSRLYCCSCALFAAWQFRPRV